MPLLDDRVDLTALLESRIEKARQLVARTRRRESKASHGLIARLAAAVKSKNDAFDFSQIEELPICLDGGASDAPAAAIAALESDASRPRAFRLWARLAVPCLLDALQLLHSSGRGYTDLMVNVRTNAFSDSSWFDVDVILDGRTVGSKAFHSYYTQNQVFIPLNEFTRGELCVELVAHAKPDTGGSAEPIFEVELFLACRPAIMETLANNAIWVFSSARSGSTWLAADLLSHLGEPDSQRIIDESGIGRMYGCLQMAAERFYDVASDWRAHYVESGFDYENHVPRPLHFDKKKFPEPIPVFERAFPTDMGMENQILRWHNYEFYHNTLRQTALEHVLNEWGCRDYKGVIFKCPNEGQAADFIMRAFPESYMVFLLRDGRDIIRSRFSRFCSPYLAETKDPNARRYAVAYYSHLWNFEIDIIRKAYDAHSENRRVFVRYEDVRVDPSAFLSDMARILKVSATENEIAEIIARATLENMPEGERGSDKPRQSGLVGGYLNEFSCEEIDLMERIMGDNLRRFGYLDGEPKANG